MSSPATELEQLRAAVEKAGGTKHVAARIGTTREHLHNVIWGARPLGKSIMRRLRQVVQLPCNAWLELLTR